MIRDLASLAATVAVVAAIIIWTPAPQEARSGAAATGTEKQETLQ